MTPIPLKYGNILVYCDIGTAHVLESVAAPEPTNPEQLVHYALTDPIGSPPLRDIVHEGESVLIITSDVTRYTGSEVYLPVLVDELNKCGIPDQAISILVGLGIHRKQRKAEHAQILGPLFGRISVFDHECDDPAELVDLGQAQSGLPVEINRRVLEADRVIVTGTIGIHYFAGYGGGRKGLVPGVASRKTCMATHFRIFNSPEQGGRNPNARAAQLAGNPVHEAILEAALMIKPDFLLNTVINFSKQIQGVFCGDLELAHMAGCELAEELYTVNLEKPADLAIVSCGGQPKDINFVQAHKTLDYAVHAVKPGGTIILLAACPDGFGNPSFFDWFKYEDLDTFEQALRDNYEINGQTAYATRAKASQWRIILVSEFSQEQTERMGMEKALDLDKALELAYQHLPSRPDIVIMPDGGSILPQINPKASRQ